MDQPNFIKAKAQCIVGALFEVRYGTGFGCCSGLLVQFLWCELNLDPVQIKPLSLSLSLIRWAIKLLDYYGSFRHIDYGPHI